MKTPFMLCLAMLSALTAGCQTTQPPSVAAEVQEWAAPAGAKGVRLLTEHFDIHTTSPDPFISEYLPSFLETAFGEYQKLIPVRRNGDRLAVYLFATREQWAQFTREFAPGQAYTYLHIQSGGYTDHRTAAAVAYDIGRDRTLSLLGHEGLHQYLSRQLPEPVPPWLNEGLACQFEAFDIKGHRPVFTPRRNFLRRNSLREALSGSDNFIPLNELLAMNAGDAVRRTGQPSRAYYAQIWSLVLYLREPESGYAERLRELLRDAGTDRLRVAMRAYRAATPAADKFSDGEVVFRQYITDDLDNFTNAYKDFCRRLLN